MIKNGNQTTNQITFLQCSVLNGILSLQLKPERRSPVDLTLGLLNFQQESQWIQCSPEMDLSSIFRQKNQWSNATPWEYSYGNG